MKPTLNPLYGDGEPVLNKEEVAVEIKRWMADIPLPHVMTYFDFVRYASWRGLFYRAPDAVTAFADEMYKRCPHRIEVPTQTDCEMGGQNAFERLFKESGGQGLAYRVVASEKVRYYFSDSTEAVFIRMAV